MMTTLIFSQDPILDLEISGEGADTIRILDEIMVELDYMPSQQDAQEWHQLLTNELGGEELRTENQDGQHLSQTVDIFVNFNLFSKKRKINVKLHTLMNVNE